MLLIIALITSLFSMNSCDTENEVGPADDEKPEHPVTDPIPSPW